jgi:phosphoribosylaminoimidazolecarboxamide formyltransferase/IMP cyclohydrolase
MEPRSINTALISVYAKEGLDPVLDELHALGVRLLSTGGTRKYIQQRGLPVDAVEELTGYPSILDGRVKTLHPKVFGGILGRREPDHLDQLQQYDIPPVDLVIVDLYPFENTVAQTTNEAAIIEKIDIGGISLIRAAAKNFRDVLVVPSRHLYEPLLKLLREKKGQTELRDRQAFARQAFATSSHYDTAIFQYFNREGEELQFRQVVSGGLPLRYGENPHQRGVFYGRLEDQFESMGGKALSYNNLVDIDAAVGLMAEFAEDEPTFAILKHTNPCGVASRSGLLEAWQAALACDPVSAFGGILIANRTIDLATAREINQIFYEVLIAPGFEPDALEHLQQKSKRILLRSRHFELAPKSFRSLLHGVIEQDTDRKIEGRQDMEVVTKRAPEEAHWADLVFANKCVKHLKSNAIALAKDRQLVGMGCGQTSRVDALKQAIAKAQGFGFQLEGSILASDAFFPFADSVELAHKAGIKAVVQPGGSMRDKDSIAYCNEHGLAMVLTGIRHFRH